MRTTFAVATVASSVSEPRGRSNESPPYERMEGELTSVGRALL